MLRKNLRHISRNSEIAPLPDLNQRSLNVQNLTLYRPCATREATETAAAREAGAHIGRDGAPGLTRLSTLREHSFEARRIDQSVATGRALLHVCVDRARSTWIMGGHLDSSRVSRDTSGDVESHVRCDHRTTACPWRGAQWQHAEGTHEPSIRSGGPTFAEQYLYYRPGHAGWNYRSVPAAQSLQPRATPVVWPC
jgi:hypothetical protein